MKGCQYLLLFWKRNPVCIAMFIIGERHSLITTTSPSSHRLTTHTSLSRTVSVWNVCPSALLETWAISICFCTIPQSLRGIEPWEPYVIHEFISTIETENCPGLRFENYAKPKKIKTLGRSKSKFLPATWIFISPKNCSAAAMWTFCLLFCSEAQKHHCSCYF